jgi:hypothetical protein
MNKMRIEIPRCERSLSRDPLINMRRLQKTEETEDGEIEIFRQKEQGR